LKQDPFSSILSLLLISISVYYTSLYIIFKSSHIQSSNHFRHSQAKSSIVLTTKTKIITANGILQSVLAAIFVLLLTNFTNYLSFQCSFCYCTQCLM